MLPPKGLTNVIYNGRRVDPTKGVKVELEEAKLLAKSKWTRTKLDVVPKTTKTKGR